MTLYPETQILHPQSNFVKHCSNVVLKVASLLPETLQWMRYPYCGLSLCLLWVGMLQFYGLAISVTQLSQTGRTNISSSHSNLICGRESVLPGAVYPTCNCVTLPLPAEIRGEANHCPPGRCSVNWLACLCVMNRGPLWRIFLAELQLAYRTRFLSLRQHAILRSRNLSVLEYVHEISWTTAGYTFVSATV